MVLYDGKAANEDDGAVQEHNRWGAVCPDMSVERFCRGDDEESGAKEAGEPVGEVYH